VVANLAAPGFNTGDAAGDSYDSIENLLGSSKNDILYGNNGRNTISGGAGNDRMAGLEGGDRFDGGAGVDIVTYDASGAVRVDLQSPGANTGDAKGDSYVAVEWLDGSSFNDILLGNGSANTIRGSSYPTLASGNDSLSGRGGNDALLGFDGNDILDGGAGQDTSTGGAGGDRFDFNAIAETGITAATRDIIVDFQHLADKIDVSTIDASSILAGNNAFLFRGTAAITTSTSGELRYQKFDNAGTASDFTLVYGDTDGDVASEFEIHLRGLVTLTAPDLIL
jgi:serralysin